MKLLFRAITVLSIITLPAVSSAVGWQDIVRLTNDDGISFPAPNNGKYMAVDLDSALHIVWADDRDRNFEIYHKVRSGGVWSADERLTVADDDSKRPVLVVDNLGRLHLVWNDLRDGNKEIYHRIWDRLWGPELRVTDTGGDSFASSTTAATQCSSKSSKPATFSACARLRTHRFKTGSNSPSIAPAPPRLQPSSGSIQSVLTIPK